MLDHEEFDPDELLLDPDQRGVSEEHGDDDWVEPMNELAFSEDQSVSVADVPLPIDEDEEEETEEPAQSAE